MKKICASFLAVSMLFFSNSFALADLPAPVSLSVSATFQGAASSLAATFGEDGESFNFGTVSGTIVPASNYLKISFSDSSVGYQMITIATDNSASYTGDYLCNGLVGTSTDPVGTADVVPLKWVVFDEAPTTAHTFTWGDSEPFIQDLVNTIIPSDENTPDGFLTPAVWVAREGSDVNGDGVTNEADYSATGTPVHPSWISYWNAYVQTEPADFKTLSEWIEDGGIDQDSDGDVDEDDYVAANPTWEDYWNYYNNYSSKNYDSGYGCVLMGINGTSAEIADYPVDNGEGAHRAITDGDAYVYIAANFNGAPSQTYEGDIVLQMVTAS